jgi:NADH-quinone oxidoreductase subunit I
MVEGTTDTEYYRNEVTAPTTAQVDWVAEHRPEDPTLAAARTRAGTGTGEKAVR